MTTRTTATTERPGRSSHRARNGHDGGLDSARMSGGRPVTWGFRVERVTGVEPALSVRGVGVRRRSPRSLTCASVRRRTSTDIGEAQPRLQPVEPAVPPTHHDHVSLRRARPEPSSIEPVTVDIPDDAVAVRGGDPHDPQNLVRMADQAQLSYDEGEGYALSVFVGYDASMTREQLLTSVARSGPIPNRLLAVTTAGELRAQGFTLVPDGPLPGHANVILGKEPALEAVKQFEDTFGPAETNPVYQERRRR
jgi:hypothetical protein